MKPHQIFAFLLIIASIVLGLALLFPEKGISIGNSLVLKFRYNSQTLAPQYANIDSIINIDETIDTITTDTTANNVVTPTYIDTSATTKNAIQAKTQNVTTTNQPIEYHGDNPLIPFFKQLSHADKQLIRILHYGDSQIEGDRITGYLRNLIQSKFGGSGPGLLPATPPVAQSSAIIHKASNNWRTHSIYYKTDSDIKHRKFGIMGFFSQFTPQHAWIDFSPSGLAYKSVQQFTQCNVFYSAPRGSFSVKGYVDNELKWFEDIDSCQETKLFQWEFEKPPKHFRIELDGEVSPNIYAIMLNSKTGVAVDNLPFRGSRGTEFVKLNLAQMKQMGHHLKTGLIIYQFGVNAVAYNSHNYKYYEDALQKQLKYLKRVWPQASILVVSVSDMSEKMTNGFTTRPSVKKVIEAQRNAALSEGCAFWNLYEAMGGYNSMPSWVNSKLAQKDYTHFNREGGHKIARMLFNALIDEYNKYSLSTIE